jgi:cysteine desulfurase
MQRPIYLDYMSTTPVDPLVMDVMHDGLARDGNYGNPSSNTHSYGYVAKEIVEKARQQVATAISCDSREVIFTSGATESNNLAIQGAVHFYQRQGKHIITMATEHKAVLDVCGFLETEGFEVTYLKPQSNGLLDLQKLQEVIRPDTILISIMFVNNETGVIQDITKIGKMAAENGIKFHVDAAQSMGKIPVDLSQLNVDLMSFSGHKVYAPKGIGALFVRRNPRVRLPPLMYGGKQEQGLRSGTIPTAQVAGLGRAFELAHQDFDDELKRIKQLNQQFWKGLEALGGVYLNGAPNNKVPHCLNVRFDGIDGEALLVSLRNIAVSMGSACNSAKAEPSHVLLAMGLTAVQAQSSLRISLGRYTTEEEVSQAVEEISREVKRLRELSPIWERVEKKLAEK